MEELADFGTAVLNHWFIFISGPVISLTITFSQMMTNKQVLPKWLLWAIGITSIPVSFFLVWQQDHRALIITTAQLKAVQTDLDNQTKPKLACEINQINNTADPYRRSGSTAALVIATVTNTGAASVAENYALTLVMLDGSEIKGQGISIPTEFQVVWPGRQASIRGSNALYNKTVDPIAHNGMKRGYLLFSFRGLSEERFAAGVKEFYLSLTDVHHNQAKCSSRFDQSGPTSVVDFPGLDQ